MLLRVSAALMALGITRAAPPAADMSPPLLQVETTFHQGPQSPSTVPILPGLILDHNPQGSGVIKGQPSPGQGYQPVDGDSFLCHNGSGAFDYIITSGAWWLQAGEQPRLLMALRSVSGAYAQPALLPDLGVGGQLRVFVSNGAAGKWLDKFESIDATLAPGAARWLCHDTLLGITVNLEALPLIDRCGFVTTAGITSETTRNVTITWAFGRVSGDEDVVQIKPDYGEISNPKMKFTRVYAASERADARIGRGDQDILHKTQDAPVSGCLGGIGVQRRQSAAPFHLRRELCHLARVGRPAAQLHGAAFHPRELPSERPAAEYHHRIRQRLVAYHLEPSLSRQRRHLCHLPLRLRDRADG